MKNDLLLLNAKQLRTHSTDTEQHLWYFLRAKRLSGYKFKRQYIIGRYIVDFICIEAKLVIELDGSQHMGHYQLRSKMYSGFAKQGVSSVAILG